MIDREALIDDGRVLHTAFTDFNAIDKEVAEITSEIDVLSGLVQRAFLSPSVESRVLYGKLIEKR